MQNLIRRDFWHTRTHARTHTSTRTHTGTRTHEHTDYTQLNFHSLKWAANRDLIETDEDSSTEQTT